MKIIYIFSTLFVGTLSQFRPFGNILSPATNVASNLASNTLGVAEDWSSFLAVNGKKYLNEAETKLRQGIFLANKQLVDQFNKNFADGKVSFQLGLNPFSDLSPAEFLKSLTGLKKSSEGEARAKEHRNKSVPPATTTVIPDSFDWREKGGVTPIRFQGLECGACWAFAVTGAIEGHVFKKTGKLIPLSEQNLVDCGNPYGNEGCDGGFQDYGFGYVLDNKGISKRPSYPYVEKQETCRYKESDRGAVIRGYSVIPPGDETKIKEIIATRGPVAASVNASPDTFQLYKSGIYKDDQCNKEEVNHSILIVGYGSENGQDYWIIKNSWTEKWGENGYMKLARNANNFCGIASECSFPVV